ncbi:MAG: anthranilate synthase component I [Desulfobulbaceae bacterium]|nr:anthranilate synthase component I [Desulfobulbaceae bacterium]
MYQPSLTEFRELAKTAGLIPVSREIVADLDTPLTVFAKVAGNEPHAFLLESLEGGEKWGRYSFIGLDPIATFESRGEQIEIRRGENLRKVQGDPIAELKKLLSSFVVCSNTDVLPRFFGGAVGFLGYDMVRFIENLPEINPVQDESPDSAFMIPRILLIYDNLKQVLTIVNCVVIPDGGDSAGCYQTALDQINEIVERLKNPLPYDFMNAAGDKIKHEFSSNMTKEEFKSIVDRAKKYIVAGDIIQVVLSQRFHTVSEIPPFSLYRALRHINPSPYLFYLKLGGIIQIGSSPEILVRLDHENIELRPIAGTRPRGKTVEEDIALEKELLADPKERAEHLMLVDLGRNDVGRAARHGSVEVRDMLVVERYSHVMHIVSGVHGLLTEGMDQFDVLRACFPAGTVTGAPKVRAMEIIEELESERRGPYAGAVGYFGFSGNMDFCITIRTFVQKGNDLFVQAGAGIVADSDPDKEYEETLNKAKGLKKAVELAEKGL